MNIRYFKFAIFLSMLMLPYLQGLSQIKSANLPNWFSKTENYNRLNLAVGISDPNPDTTKALEQAKINALINYSLLHDGIFSSLTNVGTGDQQNENQESTNIEYIIYTSIIKGKLPLVSDVVIKEKYFTKFKEAIVLLEINNIAQDDSNFCEYTIIRRAGFQKENRTYPFFVDELDIKVFENDSVIHSCEIIKEGAKFQDLKTKSKNDFFNDNYSRPIMFSYPESYSYIQDQKKIPSMGTPLNYGLWKAYIFNLVDQISIYNSMEVNFQFKLSTANIGNLKNGGQSLSFQQLVYSLKNVQAKKLNHSLAEIHISENNLLLAITNPATDIKSSYLPKMANKSEKKTLKKMKKENWEYLGNDDFDSAWLTAYQMSMNKDLYLNTDIEIQANSLHSGIIEGIQLAKLHLSSQMATKINSLNNSNISNDDQLLVKTAKLINVEKTGNIGPYFIFYQKMASDIYNIKMILLYDLKQIGEM